MNVAIMKSKAEQGFTEEFERVSGQLPGGDVVLRARKAAIGQFGALGLPHRRIEEWKYTDLRNQLKEALPVSVGDTTELTIADVIVALGPLAHVEANRVVFVNGRYRSELSSASGVKGLDVASMGEVLAASQDKVAEGLLQTSAPGENAVLALNTAYMTDGAVVRIGAGLKMEKPLMLVHVRAGSEAQFHAVRHVVNVGDGAQAMLIEAFVKLPGAHDDGQVNTASELSLGDGAKIHHIKLAAEEGGTTHLSNLMATLGKETEYRCFQQTHGVALARNQVFIAFKGEDAKLDLSGAFLASDQQHIDTTLVVDHPVPGCESRELFKGVLQDRARGVFQGKIIVHPIAQKTDGKQMAQALMLSPDTEFDSKPELEIYADDVACGHGSTVAEIDEDLLFYCKSRGISDADARVLLTESFIAEAIEQVELEDVQEALMTFARTWLQTATSRDSSR